MCVIFIDAAEILAYSFNWNVFYICLCNWSCGPTYI